jgi:protein-glutamine gamma-glutamyltransferase
MNVQRSLRITLAVLSCLGTLMLAVGEESVGLAAAAIVVGVVAYVACDIFHFALTGFWSNLATLVVLLLAAWQANAMAADERILAMADLMAYLQFVLLFRPKTARNLWLIALVSFLQVAVASALNTGLGFAVALLIYLFTGVLFLGQFFLYRERQRFDDAAEAARDSLSDGHTGFIGGAQDEKEGRQPSREFSRRMTGMVVGTVALAAFFFVAVPRLGQSTWVTNQIVGGRTVGFSQEINLKGTGQIFEDPDIVMRVHFKNPETGVPFNPAGELYMRGTAVTRYGEGRWQRPHSNLISRDGPPIVTRLATGRGVVEQRVTVEPLSSSTIFSCYPAFRAEATSELDYNRWWLQLNRSERSKSQRYTYTLLTPAFHLEGDHTVVPPGEQARIIPIIDDNSARERRSSGTPPSIPAELRQPFVGTEPVPSLAGLQAVAREVVRNIPPEDVYQRAKALEDHLRTSGGYSYSLTPEDRPADVDPLEDFVVNRRRGHCEFFAGALTMMLRSVGIPARIVLGYRGGEWNAVGNFYQFRQLHAHSWVEVYLQPENVPLNKLATPDLQRFANENGAWLQLDGTTSNTSADLATTTSTWYQLQQTIDYLQFLWNNYVLGMDALRQQDEVYKPLLNNIVTTFERETDRDTWKARVAEAYETVVPEFLHNSNTPTVVLSAAVIVLTMMLVFLVVGRRLGRSRAFGGGLAAAGRRSAASSPTVDFYVRLEAVLARRRLARTADQTQREFIQAACGELAELPETRAVAALPRKIVEAFYRVRFGKRALEGSQQEEIEQAIARLDAVLNAPAKA